ncbi:MAG TPA: DUF1028 domain-containing protein [Casimicrobiaceae bacterium]|nr:DUF1028 domain-containing protein [Casimicrobiaceae bacterium]
MTWSILARDASGAFGVAIASRFFAVGALCPHARGGVGALATQALVNPLYGPPGLEMLARGASADEVVRTLTGADAGRDHRQLHVIDTRGTTAAHTGSACIDWCGQLAGDGWSIAGNMLAGSRVIDDTAAAYEAARALPLAERLLAALDAGDAAGGDKRGKQAAALLVVTTEDYPSLTLRVDDHPEPFLELRRLYRKSLERFQPFTACLPSKANPAGITDRAVIEREVERFTAQRLGRPAPR